MLLGGVSFDGSLSSILLSHEQTRFMTGNCQSLAEQVSTVGRAQLAALGSSGSSPNLVSLEFGGPFAAIFVSLYHARDQIHQLCRPRGSNRNCLLNGRWIGKCHCLVVGLGVKDSGLWSTLWLVGDYGCVNLVHCLSTQMLISGTCEHDTHTQ